MSPEAYALKMRDAQSAWEAFRAEIQHRIMMIDRSLPNSAEPAPQWHKDMMKINHVVENLNTTSRS